MEDVATPRAHVDVADSAARPGVDWYLAATDATAGCLFAVGLLAFLVGAPALGLGLWAACVWLDWRVLAHLRNAPADGVALRQYLHRRVTTNGIAQLVAIALGLHLAASGRPWAALGIWMVAAGGIACSRMSSRIGGGAAPVLPGPPAVPPRDARA